MVLMDRVSDLAAMDRPVLIAGERGTGKELIASRLHFLSPRWEQVNVRVNCAAFTPEELDRELFGQTFMDGRADTNGRVYEANSGTLFLDAVETLPIHLQEKLMRTIEHGQIQATGELHEEDVDVRIVAATSTDLPSRVAQGLFRADLLDRLAFHVITLPPLRRRPDDISPLIEHFGRIAARDLGADQFPGFTAELQEQLRNHPFPGNVRELKLMVERSTVQAFLADESLSEPIDRVDLDPFDSPYRLSPTAHSIMSGPITSGLNPPQLPSAPLIPAPQMGAAPAPIISAVPAAGHATEVEPERNEVASGFSERVLAFERRLLDEAMRATNDHQGQAAKRLDLSYHQFRGLLRKHGMKK
ncbi:sigma-54-dependent Fis family transcriptional regulator [Algimonas porphyrae]|uniref:Sigma-54-dependent Fis family transcriptional regulator n=2 Tax=Algimonas porphyrae TaxID=1128113 RepID=A0ABQ5V202_9PROT|nr:sigma-54-dependent Fis family transcriptional regulator [Algimonas porphyrae]